MIRACTKEEKQMGMSDFAQDFKLQANMKRKLVSGYVVCL